MGPQHFVQACASDGAEGPLAPINSDLEVSRGDWILHMGNLGPGKYQNSHAAV